MIQLLAIIGLIVSLVLLGAAAGFGAAAIRGTRAGEAARGNGPESGLPPYPYPYPHPPGPRYGARPQPLRPQPLPPEPGAISPSPAGPRPYGAAGWPWPRTAAVEPAMRPRSSRGMWLGAVLTGGTGFVALTIAVVMLMAQILMPAHTVTAPPQAGGLSRDDSPQAREQTDQQRRQMREAGVPNPVAAIYRKPGDARVIVLFTGGSGRLEDPERDLRQNLSGVAESLGGGTDIPSSHPAGPLEGTVLCVDGLGDLDDAIVACGWADTSTIGLIAATGDDKQDTADLLLDMRADIERRN